MAYFVRALLLAVSLSFAFQNIPDGGTCTVGSGVIGGSTFLDVNTNGINDSETPVEDVIIVVYDCDNLEVGRDTTNDLGNWQVSGLDDLQTYRIEFELELTPLYTSSFAAAGNATTEVQFSAPNTCALEYAVADPNTFCEENPDVVVPCFVAGDRTSSAVADSAAILSFEYNSSGPTPTGLSTIATIGEVGALWGAAFEDATGRGYYTTVLRRHTDVGPEGFGGIYVLDFNTSPGGVVDAFTLQGVLPDNGGPAIDLGTINRTGSDTLSTSPAGGSVDSEAFSAIGKVGFGDLELQPDTTVLWTVNLNQRALLSIDITDTANYPGEVNQYLLSSGTGLPVCTDGVLRPWGLAFRGNVGYLGLVCTAEDDINGTLEAYVVSFDPDNPTDFILELTIPLNYTREAPDFFAATTPAERMWQPWADTWAETSFTDDNSGEIAYPQPILSDLGFAENGDMIIGLLDRWGLQVGNSDFTPVPDINGIGQGNISANAAGDLLKACLINGSWVLEGATSCPVNDLGTFTSESLTNDGPSGSGEFFWGDFYVDDAIFLGSHNETFLGSFEILPGSNEVIAAHYDPDRFNPNAFFSQGVLYHDINNGPVVDSFLLITNTGAAASKGVALGDFLLVCPPPLVQIGNYVWIDTIQNGIQDACEPSLPGVMVSLLSENGTVLATTTTDANGQYLFSGNGTGDGATWLTSNDTLSADSIYTIQFGTGGQYDNSEAILTIMGIPYRLTDADIGTGPTTDINDSDASIIGSFPSIIANPTPIADHSFDVGFAPLEPNVVGDTTFLDVNANGIQDAGDLPLEGVTVSLFDTMGNLVTTDFFGNPISGMTTTDANGAYLFDSLPRGNYYVVFDVTTAANGTDYIPTIENANGNTLDSDDSDANALGISDTTEFLLSADTNLTLDAGWVLPVVVGDTTFVDVNRNGAQDAGDLPLAGVTVRLFDATTGTLVTMDAYGNSITGSEVTDVNGFYLFDSLSPGDYFVTFDLTTVPNFELLDFTIANVSGNAADAIDSDADTLLTLNPDSAVSGNTGFIPSDDSVLTLDAGVVCVLEVDIQIETAICRTNEIALSAIINPTLPPALTATWSSSGNGTFVGGTDFATATAYSLGSDDISNGQVTLSLTADGGTVCGMIMDEETVTILNVECGEFPWNGQND